MEVLHRKVCRTSEQMRKEMAVLASLASTAIQKVIPKVVVSVQQAEPTTFMTSHIEGLMPIADNLDLDFMIHLGALAKRVHEIGNYQAFGFLDESLNIHQPIRFFSEFIERQIQKWTIWHDTALSDAYTSAYSHWLRQGLEGMSSYFNYCKPLFCHGDFDLKNLLVKSGIVVGLVDWEHAGVYCFEWELRKLSRFCHQQPELLTAFFEGYFGQIPRNHAILEQSIYFMEAVDLLGHLRWCIVHDQRDERDLTISRMHQFFQPVEEG